MTMRTHGNDIHEVVEAVLADATEQEQAQADARELVAQLLYDEQQPTPGELLFAVCVGLLCIAVTSLAIIGLDRVLYMFR